MDERARESQFQRLIYVDRAIEAVRAAAPASLNERLGVFAAAVISYCNDRSTTVQMADEVFEGVRSREGRRFLAICLLRLASERREVFDDPTFRLHSVKLFDDVLAADVYRLCGLAESAQGHEKIDLLSELTPQAVREVSEAVEAFATRTEYAQARTHLLSVLRSQRVAPFISHFVPRSLTGVRLEELLARVDAVERARKAKGCSRLTQKRWRA
jgi:hypothetical protein